MDVLLLLLGFSSVLVYLFFSLPPPSPCFPHSYISILSSFPLSPFTPHSFPLPPLPSPPLPSKGRRPRRLFFHDATRGRNGHFPPFSHAFRGSRPGLASKTGEGRVHVPKRLPDASLHDTVQGDLPRQCHIQRDTARRRADDAGSDKVRARRLRVCARSVRRHAGKKGRARAGARVDLETDGAGRPDDPRPRDGAFGRGGGGAGGRVLASQPSERQVPPQQSRARVGGDEGHTVEALLRVQELGRSVRVHFERAGE